ncbi:MAG: AAA family ATPase [Bacteroidetes bacterium]|nr:AAA family ATPase [Bacteroidota bacterium]
MTNLENIASELRDHTANIQLVFAFNSVGKTRLSLAYQDLCKDENGNHTGIYYNAYSEDLFVWENDSKTSKYNCRLNVLTSDLSALHGNLYERNILEKLEPYRISFDFSLEMHSNVEEGIQFFTFYPKGKKSDENLSMKISRGEERIFIWCFFLAMMEVEGWADVQSQYIFIDDPVTSLDDHNIYVTALTLYDLIELHSDKRKIIITTHHVGLLSILSDWLKKGEKSSKYDNNTAVRTLSRKHETLSLETRRNDVFLYHLQLLQILERDRNNDNLKAYHFALLRQVLETISSFLGVGRISYTLEQIGFKNADEIARIMNTLSHRKVYYYDSDHLVPDSLELFHEILDKLNSTFKFSTHISNDD